MSDYELHAVIFQEGDWWVAQVLEYDLATAARSLDQLPAELERFLTVQVVGSRECGIEPFQDLPRAPQRFWTLYERAAEASRTDQRRFSIPVSGRLSASVDTLLAVA